MSAGTRRLSFLIFLRARHDKTRTLTSDTFERDLVIHAIASAILLIFRIGPYDMTFRGLVLQQAFQNPRRIPLQESVNEILSR